MKTKKYKIEKKKKGIFVLFTFCNKSIDISINVLAPVCA
jgi:hypothetical protein